MLHQIISYWFVYACVVQMDSIKRQLKVQMSNMESKMDNMRSKLESKMGVIESKMTDLDSRLECKMVDMEGRIGYKMDRILQLLLCQHPDGACARHGHPARAAEQAVQAPILLLHAPPKDPLAQPPLET
jgi:hypothetical protein